jgi:type IV pilus assembly protein PilC
VTLRQRIRFFQQIAVLIRAGLPIRTSVDRLRERMRVPALAVLSEKIGGGDRLGEAFAAARFLPFESNLVTAGERSGHLETIFDLLAQFWQRELEFRQAFLLPLSYPIVVLNLAVIIGCGVELLTLPWPVVLAHFILRMAYLYGAGIIIFVLAKVTWSSQQMKRFWLRVPLVGRALRTSFAYRWITALRIEFGAGISLSRAVGDAWRASGFVNCDRLATEGEEAMRGGTDLSALVAGWRQLPGDWVDFIATGEVSGQFDEAFRNLEAEAARDWSLAQAKMAYWLPRMVYFAALLVAAASIVQVGKLVYVDPIVNAEKQLDEIGR